MASGAPHVEQQTSAHDPLASSGKSLKKVS